MRSLQSALVSAGIVSFAAWGAAALVLPEAPRTSAAAQDRTQAALPRPVLSTHDLMELFNQPLYEELQKALGQRPLNEDQWTTVEEHANRLAEVSNLIAIREEAAEHEQWKPFAADVQQLALDLAKSAGEQDYPAARRGFIAVVQNCNDCHQATEPDHAPTLQAFRPTDQP